jgi:hypothetical protein
LWRFLTDSTSEDLTTQAIMAFDPMHAYGYEGGSELAIPWDVLYGLGPGLVPTGTKIGVVASVCWDPEPDGELGGDSAPNNVSATLPEIDNFHEVTVDGDNDGVPDPGNQASVPGGDQPLRTRVLSAYPSPARTEAHIPVILGATSGGRKSFGVRADVFDITGRRVKTVFKGNLPPGKHVLDWDGRTAYGRSSGAGIYFMRVTADGNEIGTVKIIRLP